jgi:hypothetical protein
MKALLHKEQIQAGAIEASAMQPRSGTMCDCPRLRGRAAGAAALPRIRGDGIQGVLSSSFVLSGSIAAAAAGGCEAVSADGAAAPWRRLPENEMGWRAAGAPTHHMISGF